MVAVCAAAGVITAMTTKTGLGAQFSSVLVRGVDAITDNRTLMLALTAIFAAVALAMLGLAIPVTASFIIGWVIIGPALLELDVPAPAAAMFVFYYSVLSEVTPPTALAAVGASAVTGGRADPDDVAHAAVRGARVLGAHRVRSDRARANTCWAAARRSACCGWSRRRARASRRFPSPSEGGCSAWGLPGWIPRLLAGAAALLLLFLDPVTIAAGWRVCSRQSRSPSSTGGDGNETCDDCVRWRWC